MSASQSIDWLFFYGYWYSVIFFLPPGLSAVFFIPVFATTWCVAIIWLYWLLSQQVCPPPHSDTNIKYVFLEDIFLLTSTTCRHEKKLFLLIHRRQLSGIMLLLRSVFCDQEHPVFFIVNRIDLVISSYGLSCIFLLLLFSVVVIVTERYF